MPVALPAVGNSRQRRPLTLPYHHPFLHGLATSPSDPTTLGPRHHHSPAQPSYWPPPESACRGSSTPSTTPHAFVPVPDSKRGLLRLPQHLPSHPTSPPLHNLPAPRQGLPHPANRNHIPGRCTSSSRAGSSPRASFRPTPHPGARDPGDPCSRTRYSGIGLRGQCTLPVGAGSRSSARLGVWFLWHLGAIEWRGGFERRHVPAPESRKGLCPARLRFLREPWICGCGFCGTFRAGG
ncbi:hypothetical protein VUR80DRAFT_3604 [Thermomyces stellatus]